MKQSIPLLGSILAEAVLVSMVPMGRRQVKNMRLSDPDGAARIEAIIDRMERDARERLARGVVE